MPQTAFYSHLLADLQHVEPRWTHLGNGEFASVKVDDFAAYERQTRRLLAAAIGGDPAAEVYPEPVGHCAICRSSGTRSWIPNGTATAAWSPNGGCSRCPNRPTGTCSSISRGTVLL